MVVSAQVSDSRVLFLRRVIDRRCVVISTSTSYREAVEVRPGDCIPAGFKLYSLQVDRRRLCGFRLEELK